MTVMTATRRSPLRACIALAVTIAFAAVTPAVRADPSATDKTAAQALFDEGRKLLDAKKFIEACPKFESSQRLDPGGGTLLNLASCNEKLGKLATSWAQFNEALSLAIRDGRQDRIAFARERIAVLEPKLPRITVKVAVPSLEGLEVRLDDTPLARAIWGNATPIDPGQHTIVATATRRLPFRTAVTIEPKEQRSIDVPALAEDPAAAPLETKPVPVPTTPPKKLDVDVVPPPAPAVESGSGRRTAGVIVGATGVIALGVGSIFGLRAFSKWSDSDKACPASSCTHDGVVAADDARTAARIADIAFAVGVLGVGIGAYLIFSSPASPSLASPAKVGVRLAPASHGGALVIDGAF